MSKRAVKGANKDEKGLDLAAFVNELIDAKGTVESIVGYLREADQHKTERARIAAEATIHVERVRAFREVVGQYLDRAFDERRVNFDALFARLDQCIERGDAQMIGATLGAMVELAKHSPLAAVSDAARFQRAIEDKETDWKF